MKLGDRLGVNLVPESTVTAVVRLGSQHMNLTLQLDDTTMLDFIVLRQRAQLLLKVRHDRREARSIRRSIDQLSQVKNLRMGVGQMHRELFDTRILDLSSETVVLFQNTLLPLLSETSSLASVLVEPQYANVLLGADPQLTLKVDDCSFQRSLCARCDGDSVCGLGKLLSCGTQ